MDFPPVQVNDHILAVKVVLTANRNAYARVRNGSVIISIPARMSEQSAQKVAGNLYARIRKDILAKPEKYLHPDKEDEIMLRDNESIALMGKSFSVHVIPSSRIGASARMQDGHIMIKVPDSWNAPQKDRAVSRLARKVLSKELKADVENKVNEFNSMYFRSSIARIRLTNASTRWGSCTTPRWSKSSSISLNYKLLFMPKECLDYVIIHELAHTKVRNHNLKFWRIVESVLPDYKERIKMLKQNAYQLKLNRVA
jgi:predicted metal-dependent hydrolase